MNAEAIFAEALAKNTAAERAAYLDEVCGQDAALRSRVETLLRSHESAGSFLGKPALQLAAEELANKAARDTTEAEHPAVDADEEGLGFLSPSDKPGSLGRLGHYEVLEVIGRGGMGIVLRGFDDKLHRVVAIKVMAAQLATNATARRRFTREAQAQAAVSHDHIVTIHAVEEANGLPYLVMQYVPGVSLQERLDKSGPLQLHEILRVGMQTASGLAAAHAQGLIHRDIKPANILLENGVERVKITDFGLARAAAEASLTQSGVVAGTPQYMSPEQAQGEAVDQRSDLFSLGSVLYAMCTGRAPFRASGSMAVLKRVCEQTPSPIRDTNPEVPDWLAGLIDKLQAKGPADRYQSAAEVADLLGRHLAHVQHPSVVGQVSNLPPDPGAGRKPAPRQRTWAVAAALLFVLIGGFSMTEATGVTNVRATVMRIFTADGTLIVEVNDPGVKVTIEGDGGLVITGAGPHEVRLRPGSYKLQAAKDGKPIRLDQELVTITRGGKQVVGVAVETKKLPEAAAALPESDEIRRFEGQPDRVQSVAYSPTGELVAAGCVDGSIELWNARSGRSIRAIEGHTSLVTDLVFSRHGKHIFSGGFDGTVRRWDVATGKQLQRLENGAGLHSLAVSADGGLALAGGVPGRRPGSAGFIQLWDLNKGERLPQFGDQPSTQVFSVAISPDGRRALSGGQDSLMRLWDMASGKELQRLPHPGWVGVAFSSDGRRALSHGDRTIQLWNWEHGKLVRARRLLGHQGHVGAAVFSPDGRQVVSSGADNTMRLWEVETGNELHRFVGHAELFRRLAFSPDGRYILSGSQFDGSVRLWKVPERGSYRKPGAKGQIDEPAVALVPGKTSAPGALAAYYRHQASDHAGRKEWDKAIAACDKAIELDRANVRGWSQRASYYTSLKQWSKALDDYTKVVELDSKNAEAWHQRALGHAILAQWDKAAADSVRAVELNPDGNGVWWWMERAAYHLQAGNTAAYRAACKKMLGRFGQTKSPIAAHRVALSCLLLPQAVHDEQLVLHLAEQSAAGAPHSQWCLITLGVALYRAGQFEAGAQRLGLLVKTWPEDPDAGAGAGGDSLLTWLVLAMAHHRLGHAEEARRWLDKAAQRMDKESAAKEIGRLRQESHVWAMCLVLRGEAEQVLGVGRKRD